MSAHVPERLSAYLDGELGREERAAVDEHLGACAECAQRLEELAALDEVARSLPVAAPAGYFEALPARVRARLEARRRVPRVPVWSWAAAAALLLAALTPAVLQRAPLPAAPPQQQPPPATRAEEPSARLLESKDDSLKRHQEPGGYAAAPAPAAPVAPPAAARPTPAPELRKKVPEEAADRYAAAPPAMKPADVPTPTPLAAEVPELDESRRENADADQPRAAAQEAQRSRRDAAGESEGGRMAAAGTVSTPPDKLSVADARYGSLLAAAAPGDANAARALRDAWRVFARDHPTHAGTDEARVRALEAGAAAYRLSRDPRDLESVRTDAAAYLARPDAAQADRVHALLKRLKD
jgi:anti-sigma factor RsiW